MVNLPQYPLFSEFVRWLTLSPVLWDLACIQQHSTTGLSRFEQHGFT